MVVKLNYKIFLNITVEKVLSAMAGIVSVIFTIAFIQNGDIIWAIIGLIFIVLSIMAVLDKDDEVW